MRTSLLLPILFLFFTAAVVRAEAESSPRERILFDADWRFQKGDPAGVGDSLEYEKLKPWLLPTANAFVSLPRQRPAGEAPGERADYAQPGFDDSGWRRLTLPHDWGIEGPFDQALPGEGGKLPWFGVAWYRKTFDLPASDQGRQVYLEIDGAMSYSAVWCNGKFVGGWPYGYASYHLDLTPYLKAGARNSLAIRLDNPKKSSRWYPGGGVYRNVWLEKTSPIHVDPWGVFVTTPEVSAERATVNVQVTVDNGAGAVASLTAKTVLFELALNDDERTRVVEFPSVTLNAGKTTQFSVTSPLEHPKLWSLQSPKRYAVVTTLEQGGNVVDRCETVFGVRKAEFTVADGFRLNGQRVPIQGVCMHHDLGALGAAVNTRAMERQIEILKEMGVNAIRTSHNPPAPELLDLCDRMGMLVMDESVDCWKIGKKPNGYNLLFADWSQADIRAYVRRDRNHPSVVLFSIGNEIPEQSRGEGPAIGKELSGFVHREDPTRPTTIAVSSAAAGYNGFQTCVDVFGYNYKPFEYKRFREKNPDQPLFGSETSSTVSSRGEYFFPVNNARSDFQVSSYDSFAPIWATMPDAEFKGQDENPFVAGEFVWTGFDYLGEPSPYNSDSTNLLNYHNEADKARAAKELKALGKIKAPSRSSYFGIVDLAGFKKDRFYLYQARWRPDFPMAHILPHWNWPDRTGQVTPVFVYTSGDEAELFLNGQSLGRKKKAPFEYRLRWDDVKYAPGELKVIAYKNGKEWAVSSVKTTGAAARLLLAPDRATIKADGLDLSFVTVTVADKDGQMVPQSHPKLKFAITGPGEIVATDNGDPTDHTTFSSPERNAFNGLALAVVRAKPGAGGAISLRVTGEGLPPGEVILTSTP